MTATQTDYNRKKYGIGTALFILLANLALFLPLTDLVKACLMIASFGLALTCLYKLSQNHKRRLASLGVRTK